jgi:hypothetical protein
MSYSEEKCYCINSKWTSSIENVWQSLCCINNNVIISVNIQILHTYRRVCLNDGNPEEALFITMEISVLSFF